MLRYAISSTNMPPPPPPVVLFLRHAVSALTYAADSERAYEKVWNDTTGEPPLLAMLLALTQSSWHFSRKTALLDRLCDAILLRYALISGVRVQHLAKIAYKNHKHSVHNANSQFRDEYSLDDILKVQIYPVTTMHREQSAVHRVQHERNTRCSPSMVRDRNTQRMSAGRFKPSS